MNVEAQNGPRRAGTRHKPARLLLAAFCAVVSIWNVSIGIEPFVHPGQDAFEAIGYMFGALHLALVLLALLGGLAAMLSRRFSFALLVLPLVSGGISLVLAWAYSS